MRDTFLLLGDLNGHHQEWLGSATTTRHGVTAIGVGTVSGCQLVVGPTHARCGTLDLLMTDVPDQVRVGVVALIGITSLPCAGGHVNGIGGSKFVCL